MHPNVIPLFIVIYHTVAADSTPWSQKVNETTAIYEEVKLIPHPRFKHRYESQVLLSDGVNFQRHFTDGINGKVGSERRRRVEVPVQSVTTEASSFWDYFDGKDEEEDDEDNEDEEDEDDDDDDGENNQGSTGGIKKKPNLRGVRRKYVRAHKILFPLLLAYKLKFFTMLPLLVGSLVLLIGTTGIAGFFFALFSAALGLHVKAQH